MHQRHHLFRGDTHLDNFLVESAADCSSTNKNSTVNTATTARVVLIDYGKCGRLDKRRISKSNVSTTRSLYAVSQDFRLLGREVWRIALHRLSEEREKRRTSGQDYHPHSPAEMDWVEVLRMAENDWNKPLESNRMAIEDRLGYRLTKFDTQ